MPAMLAHVLSRLGTVGDQGHLASCSLRNQRQRRSPGTSSDNREVITR